MSEGKARLLVFDCETVYCRQESIVQRLRQEAIDKRPAKNAAKDDKLEWDTEEARDERAREAIRKTSMDVLLAEVLCTCFRADGAAYAVQMMEGDAPDLEYAGLLLLAEAFGELAGPDTVWIGHNVLSFDLPLLLNRWRHHDIRPPEHFPCFVNGRWQGRVYDTMRRTPSDNALGMVSFAKVCEAYGIPGAKTVMWRGEPMDGGRVSDAWEAGEYDIIEEYCACDVEVNERLYLRMTCDDTWGTYDTRKQITDQIEEIEQSDLTVAQKAIAKMMVLEGAGLLPRSA